MSSISKLVVGLLGALACASPATAASGPGPGLQISWRPSGNYTRANRPASMIRLIVIHSTGGGYLGSISWLDNPRAQASAHYVVSRTGQVTQLVRDSDIAWHAGNWAINRESIGIEHEGYVGVPGSYTDAEYRASAKLAGWIARTHLLPIDRRHFIGHSEVPDPNHPGRFGGFAHHTDPGRYWDWQRYLSYVRTYARGSTPPVFHTPKPATAPALVKVTREQPRATKPGAKPSGGGVGPIFAFAGLQPGKGLSGFVPWQADVGGDGVSKVEFMVDGRLRWSARRPPFRFGGDGGALDTTQLPNGPHVLSIRVVASGGHVSGSSVKVGVLNTPFQLALAQPANGQTVGGRVKLVAAPSGGLADHVDFVVDGRVVRTEKSAPFEDDWDTTKIANGPHTLTLRGVAQDGRVATTTATVIVANASPAPKPAPAPSDAISIRGISLGDGQTVSGQVRLAADVRSRDLERVEFWIDGALRWTAGRDGPYAFGGGGGRWDTTRETNGRHVVLVRAVAVSGVEARTAAVVTVANRAPTPLAVALPLQPGQVVSGSVHVVAAVQGDPSRVEFWVDGSLRHVERAAPYEYDWDTSRESAGAHTLLVKAVADGQAATATDPLTVAGLSVQQTLADGRTVTGTVHVDATVSGDADRVEFRVDGRLAQTDTSAPYGFDWDTTTLDDGPHSLAVTAVGGSRAATASARVTTQNAAPLGVALPLRDEQVVSGVVHVVAPATGSPKRVEFWVDGSLRHVEQSAPYEFSWDTRAERDGEHQLVAKAVAGDRSAAALATVVVRNAPAPTPTTTTATTTTTTTTTTKPTTTSSSPSSSTSTTTTTAAPTTTTTTTTTAATTTTVTAPPPPPLSVSTSLASGQTVSGTVHVVATPSGDVRRVEFWVDGSLWHTEREAPYEFDWRTSRLAPGQHLLLVRAKAKGDVSAEASVAVVVAP